MDCTFQIPWLLGTEDSCQGRRPGAVFPLGELRRSEAERIAGTDSLYRMDQDPQIIVAYTDAQAVADGVLVPFPGDGGVNRTTRAVFDHFEEPVGSSPATGEVTDITPIQDAIRTMRKVEPDEHGWRTGAYQGKDLWLVPNEVGGLTLLFPDDY